MYTSPHVLLGEMRIRLDAMGAAFAGLFVEGPDDKRLLLPEFDYSGQIVPCGGQPHLLAVLAVASDADRQRMAFLVDCDYEVTLGNLSPQPGLVISKNVDIEADLLEAGLFDAVAVEFVPAALANEHDRERISATLRDRAVEFARILGQVRQVAKQAAVKIDTSDIKYRRCRIPKTTEVDVPGFIQRLGQQLDFVGLDRSQFESAVLAANCGYKYCNGHDLVYALHFILREDYRVDVTRGTLESFMRGAAGRVFDSLDAVQRLRAWEREKSRILFASDIPADR